MTYSEKVKQSKIVLEAIYGLEDGQSINVTYGTDRQGKFKQYSIRAYKGYKDEMSYSIWNSFSGMNIDSLTKTQAKAYTYDMMSQRTNYNFPLYEMKIVTE